MTRTSAKPATILPPDQIVDFFQALPGNTALKILVPASATRPEFSAQLNPDTMWFTASANKTFVLCEAFRQADSSDVDSDLEAKTLTLDSSVWSLGSPIFNPPEVRGIVSERTALEAMIMRSDNTATDMMFKLVGPENVRAFIASQGLTNTRVPGSTRALTAYVFGAKTYKTMTWNQLNRLVKTGRQAHPFLNDVETVASSAGDLVTYYSRALQGAFFTHPETLHEFRRILTLCDFIYLVPLPLGVSAYAKSGNADFTNFHARSLAGGMFVGGQWVYFAFIINWHTPSEQDPDTVEKFFGAINRTLASVQQTVTGDGL